MIGTPVGLLFKCAAIKRGERDCSASAGANGVSLCTPAHVQSGHWGRLDGPLRTQLADCVACSLDFAVLYNSDLHVRDRMRTTGPERCASIDLMQLSLSVTEKPVFVSQLGALRGKKCPKHKRSCLGHISA